MNASKAVKILEDRHAWLIGRAKALADEGAEDFRIHMMYAEMAAVETAIEAILEKRLRERVERAARKALFDQLSNSSC